MEIRIRPPAHHTEDEIRAFHELVVEGDEVQKNGLENLIRCAQALGLLYVDGHHVGVAGLKRPRADYRKKIFGKAKSDLAPDDFPFELGWVHIRPSHRSRKLSLPLVVAMLWPTGSASVYATSHNDEEHKPMHHTLAKCGFEPDGRPWQNDNRETLRLFVRKGAVL